MSFRPLLPVRFACAAAFAAAAAAAPAQSLVQQNGRHLAHTGDAAPGYANGEVFSSAFAFNNGVLDDAGNVVFRGRVDGTGVVAPNDRGLFFGSSRANLVRLFGSGDPEPTGLIPGATMNTPLSPGIGGLPQIAGSGAILFCMSLSNGVTSTNDSAIVSGAPTGPWTLVAREGDVMPGGAALASPFGDLNYGEKAINDAGFVFVQSNLAGGDVSGTTNNVAWISGTPGNLAYAIRKGDVAPGGELVWWLGTEPRMNSSGQIIGVVGYALTGAVPATTADNVALWIYTPGVGSVEVMRKGGPTPYPNTIYEVATQQYSWSPAVSLSGFASSGRALVFADLAGPGVTPSVNDRAIVLAGSAGVTPVMRKGDPIPGLPGVSLLNVNALCMAMNDHERIAVQVRLAGAGVTGANDSAILAGPASGPLTAVVREGDPVPGTGGVFGDVHQDLFLQLNNSDQFVFRCPTAAGVNPAPALFAWDPVAGVLPVLNWGESHEVQPGVFKASTTYTGVRFGNGDGRSLSFNDAGDIALQIQYVDGSASIVVCSIPSLVASPAGVSTATGGTQTFAISAGAQHAGLVYYMAGSASGTAPGFAYGPLAVPLNYDFYTDFSINFANVPPFSNTLGFLDGAGRASAAFTLPTGYGILAGATLHHAYVVLDFSMNALFVSEPVALNFLP